MVVKDYSGVPYLNNPNNVLDHDEVCCETPIEGFLTKDRTYKVLGLRSEESRIVVIDDRGLEMWARSDRFRLWITPSKLLERFTTCKDCGVDTQPGVGSARCEECWNSRFGTE